MSFNVMFTQLPSEDINAFICEEKSAKETQKMLNDSGSEEKVIAFLACDSEKNGRALEALYSLSLLNSEYDDSIGAALEEVLLKVFELGRRSTI